MNKTLLHKVEINNKRLDNKLENKSIKRIGSFQKSSKEKINFLCLICEIPFLASFDSIIRSNTGCPNCNKSKKLTENFVRNILIGNNISLLNNYINVSSKMKLKCLIDGHEFERTYNSMKNYGFNCPRCTKKERYTNERIDELLIDRNIKRISDYINSNTKLEFKCLIDGYIWKVWPSQLLGVKEAGCPECAGNARYTNESFDLKIINRQLIRLENFKNTLTPIKMKCLVCDYDWFPYPSHILKGHGCPKCAGTLKLTLGEVQRRLLPLEIELLDEYTGVNNRNNLKCLKCNNIWDIDLNHVFSAGTGCPFCYKKNETLVGKLIEEIFGIIPNHNKRLFIENRQFIVYDYKFKYNNKHYILEYNGRQHYQSVDFFGGEDKFVKQQERDKLLRQYCKDTNIILIEIPYWLSKSEQIELLRSYILGD